MSSTTMKRKLPKEVQLETKCCDCGVPIRVTAWETEDPKNIPCERCWIESLFHKSYLEKKKR